MITMERKVLKIINILLILSAIGLGLWLLNKNFPRGDLVVDLDLEKAQPMISALGPEVRIVTEDDYYIVLESPVYFDLRSMPWFKQADIYLVFQGQDILEGIGIQTGPGWSYEVREPVAVVEAEDGFFKALFSFDLQDYYQQKNVRRFLISTKAGEQDLKIKSLQVRLKR